MAEWMGSLAVVVFWLGVVSVFVPLKLIGIRSRKAGVLVLIVGFALVTVLAGMEPSGEPADEAYADPLGEYPFKLLFENGRVLRGKTVGKLAVVVLNVRTVSSIAYGDVAIRPQEDGHHFLVVDLYMQNNHAGPLMLGDVLINIQDTDCGYSQSEEGNRAMAAMGYELFQYKVLAAKAAQIGVVVFEVPTTHQATLMSLVVTDALDSARGKLPTRVINE